MEKGKSDFEQLLGILSQFERADVLAAVRRLDLSVETFPPAVLVSSLLAATSGTATKIDKQCGTPAVVESTNKPASKVSVYVTNTGDCSVSVKLSGGGVSRGSVSIPAGDSGSISTSAVDKVVIDCDGGAGTDPRCKLAYSINWQ